MEPSEPLAASVGVDEEGLLTGLPKPPHVELVERLIITDEGDILNLTLCDQHAVEWVPVRACQIAGTLGVKDRDIEWLKALTGHAGGDVGGDVSRARELPSRAFVVISHADAALTRIALD